ncbi:hypothetical protein E0H40_12815 [Rhizobium leguminosarum bv. viciae]|nr:hypothetical protein E0H40_12815 [Rhizobium leguminosarum bv. viciae]
MRDDSTTFDATEATRQRLPTVANIIDDFAFAQANEFIDAGQSEREATSIVANMLIRAAWKVAAIGVLSQGGEPDKEKFRATVEAQLSAITFTPKAAKEGGEA